MWHFQQRTDTLFKVYVKTFLKCKQEASGYPPHVITPEDKQKYIEDYFEKEGIRLDPSKIKANKAIRSCSKLLLNSLWGRYSARTDIATTELLLDPERFSQIMFSDLYSVKQFCFVSEDVAIVQWRYANGQGCNVKDVNVFIGAMTTAYARLELYDLLDRLDRRVIYFDTDSVVFSALPDEWVPETGSYLGELTSELDDGDHIVEFVSGGPKCYCYRTMCGKTLMKCKGVTLNSHNAKIVTHETLKGLVEAFVSDRNSAEHVTTSHDNIVRDKKNFCLRNKTLLKKVQVVYNKRRVLSDYSTLPYGF